jgi:DNA-binding HxlR family transcriptional regulator
MVARGAIGYGQFCPIAMSSEVLYRRWTTLILREMLCGSTRFNELRRGLPRLSPALLSICLRELAEHGLLERRGAEDEKATSYRLTPAGEALRPLIIGMGEWGHRWIESSASLANLDPSLLMWDIRRNLKPDPMPPDRAVIQFLFSGLPPDKNRWWLIVDAGAVDLCYSDPGFDVDLYIATDLRTMTAIWMDYASIKTEVAERRVFLNGEPCLCATVQDWLGFSPFAADMHAAE